MPIIRHLRNARKRCLPGWRISILTRGAFIADNPAVFLFAVHAALARAPQRDTSPQRCDDLVSQMRKRGNTASLLSDILNALTDESLLLSERLPTFDH